MTSRFPAAVIDEMVRRLRAAGCVFAEDEAAVLAAAAVDGAALAASVQRRADGEPLEQVVGYADFCGLRIRLRPGVFVPRVRSELLVREATTILTRTAHDKEPVVVDLCCGSGALGLAVRRGAPGTDLYAADLDPAAVACARDNFDPEPERVFAGDLFDALPSRLRGSITLFLANVPYVATRHIGLLPAEARVHEPLLALDGGEDGLHVFRRALEGVVSWGDADCGLLSEITEAQAPAAERAVRRAGLRPSFVTDDDLEALVVRALR